MFAWDLSSPGKQVCLTCHCTMAGWWTCYSVVKDFSYNQLVEMVINDSVKTTSGELTWTFWPLLNTSCPQTGPAVSPSPP